MRRWRTPLALSGILLLAQLLHRSALHDVATGLPPVSVALKHPLTHLVFAPFTLVADWLNGGGTGDLAGFGAWAVVAFALARLFASGPRRLLFELRAAAGFLVCFGVFIWWGARWTRPIPRLVAADSSLLIFDAHSHTSMSHDGRPGFGTAANAAWHQRAGFDAAFVTDHNTFGAARQWQHDAPGRPPRLLDGEELSLSGLHLIVLGNDSALSNVPWTSSFDSTLALLRALRARPADSAGVAPLLVASLPEYWRYHWGADLGVLVAAGIEGFEVWTTSPKAMDIPPGRRGEVLDRGRSLDLALVGATDMHGLGYAATVWNVIELPGWQELHDAALTRSLVAALRDRPGESRVIALRRRLAVRREAQMAGVPLGLFEVLRTTSPFHRLSCLAWPWLLAAALARRGRKGEGPATAGPSSRNAPV